MVTFHTDETTTSPLMFCIKQTKKQTKKSDDLPREQYITISYNRIIMEKAKPQIRSSREFEMASS